MRLTGEGLRIATVGLVFQEESVRTMLQPWIDRWQESAGQPQASPLALLSHGAHRDPLEEFHRNLLVAVGETLVLGLRRADTAVMRSWQELVQTAEAFGMERLAASMRRVVEGLSRRAAAKQWDWRPTAQAVLAQAVLARLAHDLSSGC
jgi:hypothetical protein